MSNCPDDQPELQLWLHPPGLVTAGLRQQDSNFLHFRLRALLVCFQRTARQSLDQEDGAFAEQSSCAAESERHLWLQPPDSGFQCWLAAAES